MTVKKEKITVEKKSKPKVKKIGEEIKKDSVSIQGSLPGAVPEISEKPGKQKKRVVKKTETVGVSEDKIEEKSKRGRKKAAPVKEHTESLSAPAVPDVKHEAVKPRKKAEQAVEVKHEAVEPIKKEVIHPEKSTSVVPGVIPAVPQEKKPVIQTPHVVPVPPVPVAAPVPVTSPAKKELELNFPIAVKDFAVKLQEKPSVLIKYLMSIGVMAGINQMIDEQTVRKTCEKYGYQIKLAPNEEEAALGIHLVKDTPESLKPRAPIITLMGHVDHGKTSLLDAIRKSKVAETEHGGITQHIGAYRLKLPHGEITFLDTPGHEAFTAMRARGAKATDIVILVVAADDGIMPQTKEAADHAKAAGVTIVVAVNKIDKPQADLDRVKKQLTELDLLAEDWGGKTITVPVSAKTGEGIDTLLEMLILEAEMLELKANPNRLAQGVVLEGKMVKNKGPVATLLVQNGTLRLNNYLLVGHYHGKIRAMFNDRGHSVTEAGPSMPVEVLGISGIPEAGEQFYVLEDEKLAKELAVKRQEQERDKQMKPVKRLGLEDLYAQIKEGKLKELKLILKADAQGSLEAIKDVLGKLNISEVKLNILHEGIGNINISDVMLAVASDALILGFNVEIEDASKVIIEKEGQEVRTYNIIYELANDIKAALEGMLEPKLKKIFLGKADVRKVFKLSSSGIIAGSFVSKGKIIRSAHIRVVRNGQEVFEGYLASLKRFKDDVREVEEGFECGISVKGFDQVMEGDVIEAYDIKKIARTIEDVNK